MTGNLIMFSFFSSIAGTKLIILLLSLGVAVNSKIKLGFKLDNISKLN